MIIVFGSIYMDISFSLKTLPERGIPGYCDSYDLDYSGKAAIQAFVAGRMGEKTALVGTVGDDGFGIRILNKIRRNGVMTSGVAQPPDLQTSCNIKTAEGDLFIRANGANDRTSSDQVPEEILNDTSIVVIQTELTWEQNLPLLKKSKENNSTTILNILQEDQIPDEAFQYIDYLIFKSDPGASDNQTKILSVHW